MRPKSAGKQLIPAVIVLLVVALLSVGLAAQTAPAKTAPAKTAPAQKPEANPASTTTKYDRTTETTVKGTIDEVKEVPGPDNQLHIQLLLKNGDRITEIRLCPRDYLKELEVNFAKGDEVEITGSRIKIDDREVILARSIVKGNSTLVLRDKQGNPVWSWLTK